MYIIYEEMQMSDRCMNMLGMLYACRRTPSYFAGHMMELPIKEQIMLSLSPPCSPGNYLSSQTDTNEHAT